MSRYVMNIQKKLMFFCFILLSGCETDRGKAGISSIDITSFCKGLEEYKSTSPSEDAYDTTLEECSESRVIVVHEVRKQEPLFSGKVLSVHYYKDEDRDKVLISVEKYLISKNICGQEKMIDMENVHERNFYTVDEEEYLSFTALKECKL